MFCINPEQPALILPIYLYLIRAELVEIVRDVPAFKLSLDKLVYLRLSMPFTSPSDYRDSLRMN